MKIIQITTDSREHFKDYATPQPYFGTAPQGLLSGFAFLPDVEVHVVSCVRKPVASPEKIAENIYYHSLRVPTLGWGRTLFLGCVHAVRKLANEIKPDIVHGQGTERDCALAAVLSGYPNILTIHGNMRVHAARQENHHNRYYKMAARLEKFCLKRTSGTVAISRYTQNLVHDLSRRTWLLPNAVDQRFFSIQPITPVIPRILFVGSLDERKNPLGLLRACEEMLRKGRCTLVLAGQFSGDGKYGAEVMELAGSLPGVTIAGFLSRENLAAEFGRSSLLVLPTFEDNCPMVILEAMAAGLPVAASRVGGVPDLVEHGTDGLLFDPHDSTDMRSSIERLAKDSDLQATFAARSRTKALECFHPRVIARRHVEIYREVLAG